MRRGHRGWDVAALQFLLQRAGHGPGRADGLFGPLTQGAVLRAQRAAGVAVDGIAGPVTIRSLRGGRGRGSAGPPSGPVRFLRPVPGPIGSGFAPESAPGRRHDGVDFPEPYGTRVGAAGVGTTISAGYNYGGYGNLVVVQHRLGFTTWYAHLSSISTSVGQRVTGGSLIGYVGSTGHSTGPHLHFEVRRYNTPINPVPRLLATVARNAGGVGSGPAGKRPDRTGECGMGVSRTRRAPRNASWIDRERLCKR
jgi:murein DD-endopeptidase MepM/ murein hydrolase activator NlpD